MLQKFALAFKTKTIEFFAEEEEEDADDVAASAAAGGDGVLAGQRVVVLKPDPQNPNPSGGEGEGSGEEAAVAAALATASLFQATHSPFLPEAAAAADAAAVSHHMNFLPMFSPVSPSVSALGSPRRLLPSSPDFSLDSYPALGAAASSPALRSAAAASSPRPAPPPPPPPPAPRR